MKRKQMKNKKFSLNDYLLGGNDNLIGTIIGFKKGLIYKNLVKWHGIELSNKYIVDGEFQKNYLPEGFAVLLYFDHRTCRIERHLFNPNLVFMGKNPNILDVNDNSLHNILVRNPYLYNGKLEGSPIIELKNEEISHYFQDGNISYNNSLLREISFDILADGKLNKNMMSKFMWDLIVNYLLSLYSNLDKNVDILEDENITDIREIRKLKFKNADRVRRLVIDYPSNETMKEIYVPKHLFIDKFNYTVTKPHNIKFISKLLNDVPPVLTDLKSLINSNTVLNNTKLCHLIHKFNRINVDRCNSWEEFKFPK
uniref:Uncharacterized protein n=1 Tax=Tricholoma bakamatsutake TaxID=51221 RepID=A0A6C0W659_9AGAR|nr:hypothetical protein [Tricholoma bakamatsutake]QIC20212.1 hypothetical protein [Tricholoma bakamatsutake]